MHQIEHRGNLKNYILLTSTSYTYQLIKLRGGNKFIQRENIFNFP